MLKGVHRVAPKNKRDSSPGLHGEAPPVLMVVACVLLVIGLSAGGFYAFNGGWKTAGQKADEYTHYYGPIMAAKHGDLGPLEAENRLRTAHGQPLLEMPKDKAQTATDSRQKVADLQKLLAAKQGNQSGQ